MRYALVLLLIPFVIAHATGGQTSLVDDYRIDLGYPEAFEDREIPFQIVLEDADDHAVPYDFVDVTIRNRQAELYHGTVNDGLLTYHFENPDLYSIELRFMKDDSELVTASFMVPVSRVTTPTAEPRTRTWILIAVIGAVGVAIYLSRRK